MLPPDWLRWRARLERSVSIPGWSFLKGRALKLEEGWPFLLVTQIFPYHDNLPSLGSSKSSQVGPPLLEGVALSLGLLVFVYFHKLHIKCSISKKQQTFLRSKIHLVKVPLASRGGISQDRASQWWHQNSRIQFFRKQPPSHFLTIRIL